jgi:predicted nucleotidyltransferase
MSGTIQPMTPYPDVNEILDDLMAAVRRVLGDQVVGMYLDGSLASGDFDQDSDIDFVVVTRDKVSDGGFLALQAMHDRIATLDTPWAVQLEGSYISRHAVRRCDPDDWLYPNIERGRGERLKLAVHNEAWDIHRWMLRERGIILFGPHPQTLIDPVPAERLRLAMRPMLAGWADRLLEQPVLINSRGYQTYIVLTICRVLYTLETGAVASKPEAASWAQENLDPRWFELIERSWEGRRHPDPAPTPEDVQATLAFIRFTQDRNR